MRVEGLADAWGVVVAWFGVLLGASWALSSLAFGEGFHLHPGAAALGLGAATAVGVAGYWANVERFGQDEGFTAEWYRPFRTLSIYWLAAFFRSLASIALPSTLIEAAREAGPKTATALLVLAVPAGVLSTVGLETLSPAPPSATAAAKEAVFVLQNTPETLELTPSCKAERVEPAEDPNASLRLTAAYYLGYGIVEVGEIEYPERSGAQLAEVRLSDPTDPLYDATLTMKLVEDRWLPCGDLVVRND